MAQQSDDRNPPLPEEEVVEEEEEEEVPRSRLAQLEEQGRARAAATYSPFDLLKEVRRIKSSGPAASEFLYEEVKPGEDPYKQRESIFPGFRLSAGAAGELSRFAKGYLGEDLPEKLDPSFERAVFGPEEVLVAPLERAYADKQVQAERATEEIEKATPLEEGMNSLVGGLPFKGKEGITNPVGWGIDASTADLLSDQLRGVNDALATVVRAPSSLDQEQAEEITGAFTYLHEKNPDRTYKFLGLDQEATRRILSHAQNAYEVQDASAGQSFYLPLAPDPLGIKSVDIPAAQDALRTAYLDRRLTEEGFDPTVLVGTLPPEQQAKWGKLREEATDYAARFVHDIKQSPLPLRVRDPLRTMEAFTQREGRHQLIPKDEDTPILDELIQKASDPDLSFWDQAKIVMSATGGTAASFVPIVGRPVLEAIGGEEVPLAEVTNPLMAIAKAWHGTTLPKVETFGTVQMDGDEVIAREADFATHLGFNTFTKSFDLLFGVSPTEGTANAYTLAARDVIENHGELDGHRLEMALRFLKYLGTDEAAFNGVMHTDNLAQMMMTLGPAVVGKWEPEDIGVGGAADRETLAHALNQLTVAGGAAPTFLAAILEPGPELALGLAGYGGKVVTKGARALAAAANVDSMGLFKRAADARGVYHGVERSRHQELADLAKNMDSLPQDEVIKRINALHDNVSKDKTGAASAVDQAGMTDMMAQLGRGDDVRETRAILTKEQERITKGVASKYADLKKRAAKTITDKVAAMYAQKKLTELEKLEKQMAVNEALIVTKQKLMDNAQKRLAAIQGLKVRAFGKGSLDQIDKLFDKLLPGTSSNLVKVSEDLKRVLRNNPRVADMLELGRLRPGELKAQINKIIKATDPADRARLANDLVQAHRNTVRLTLSQSPATRQAALIKRYQAVLASTGAHKARAEGIWKRLSAQRTKELDAIVRTVSATGKKAPTQHRRALAQLVRDLKKGPSREYLDQLRARLDTAVALQNIVPRALQTAARAYVETSLRIYDTAREVTRANLLDRVGLSEGVEALARGAAGADWRQPTASGVSVLEALKKRIPGAFASMSDEAIEESLKTFVGARLLFADGGTAAALARPDKIVGWIQNPVVSFTIAATRLSTMVDSLRAQLSSTDLIVADKYKTLVLEAEAEHRVKQQDIHSIQRALAYHTGGDKNVMLEGYTRYLTGEDLTSIPGAGGALRYKDGVVHAESGALLGRSSIALATQRAVRPDMALAAERLYNLVVDFRGTLTSEDFPVELKALLEVFAPQKFRGGNLPLIHRQVLDALEEAVAHPGFLRQTPRQQFNNVLRAVEGGTKKALQGGTASLADRQMRFRQAISGIAEMQRMISSVADTSGPQLNLKYLRSAMNLFNHGTLNAFEEAEMGRIGFGLGDRVVPLEAMRPFYDTYNELKFVRQVERTAKGRAVKGRKERLVPTEGRGARKKEIIEGEEVWVDRNALIEDMLAHEGLTMSPGRVVKIEVPVGGGSPIVHVRYDNVPDKTFRYPEEDLTQRPEPMRFLDGIDAYLEWGIRQFAKNDSKKAAQLEQQRQGLTKDAFHVLAYAASNKGDFIYAPRELFKRIEDRISRLTSDWDVAVSDAKRARMWEADAGNAQRWVSKGLAAWKRLILYGFVLPRVRYITKNAVQDVTQTIPDLGFFDATKLAFWGLASYLPAAQQVARKRMLSSLQKGKGPTPGMVDVMYDTTLDALLSLPSTHLVRTKKGGKYVTMKAADGSDMTVGRFLEEAYRDGVGDTFFTGDIMRSFKQYAKESWDEKFFGPRLGISLENYIDFVPRVAAEGSKRMRLHTYAHLRMNRGKSRAEAKALMTRSLYDWSQPMNDWEKSMFRDLILFYSYEKHATKQLFLALHEELNYGWGEYIRRSATLSRPGQRLEALYQLQYNLFPYMLGNLPTLDEPVVPEDLQEQALFIDAMRDYHVENPIVGIQIFNNMASHLDTYAAREAYTSATGRADAVGQVFTIPDVGPLNRLGGMVAVANALLTYPTAVLLTAHSLVGEEEANVEADMAEATRVISNILLDRAPPGYSDAMRAILLKMGLPLEDWQGSKWGDRATDNALRQRYTLGGADKGVVERPEGLRVAPDVASFLATTLVGGDIIQAHIVKDMALIAAEGIAGERTRKTIDLLAALWGEDAVVVEAMLRKDPSVEITQQHYGSLAAFLQAAGNLTGLFTSYHVQGNNLRIEAGAVEREIDDQTLRETQAKPGAVRSWLKKGKKEREAIERLREKGSEATP
jgi:hypothetical protein